MKRPDILICLALAAVTFGLYAPVLNSDFIHLDDGTYVALNSHVQSGFTLDAIGWAFTTDRASNWHPLTRLSHMLDCKLYGMNPHGHHLTSLLLHIANTLLLFAVLLQLTGRRWPSAIVAALFAWHPLHVESVAWVAERKDVLSCFFFLLTLAAYLRYVRKSGPGRFLLVMLMFALGLMAKPMLVTLPCLLLLLDYWPLNRFTEPALRPEGQGTAWGADAARASWKQLILEKFPLFILAGISSVVTVFVQQSGDSVMSLSSLPLSLRLENAAVSCCRYLLHFIQPIHLSVFYPYELTWPPWMVPAAVLFLALVTARVIWLRRSQPYLIVGWLWFLIALLPVIGIVQVGSQAMADRYTYIPMIGLFIMLVWNVDDLTLHWPARRGVLTAASVIVLAACLPLTRAQVRLWKNSGVLFRHALELDPDNPMAHASLGAYLREQGHTDEALGHFQTTLRSMPGMFLARFGAGACLLVQEHWQEAATQLLLADQIIPGYPEVQCKLGLAAEHLGQPAEAAMRYARALQFNPDDPVANLGAGRLLAAQGRWDEAVAHFSTSVRVDPKSPDAHYQLALAHEVHGNAAAAVNEFHDALRLRPDFPDALNDLAWLIATCPDPAARNGAEAVRLASRACELTGEKEPRFFGTLDAAYAEAGRWTEAIATAQKTRELALARGLGVIADAADKRLALYRSGQPYHESR